jgi:predicted XRE-type DNA-binding protein
MVEDICRRVEAGEQQKDVATSFGVSRPLVCQIVNGRVRQGRRGSLGREMKRHADIGTTAQYLAADGGRLRELAGKMGLRVG